MRIVSSSHAHYYIIKFSSNSDSSHCGTYYNLQRSLFMKESILIGINYKMSLHVLTMILSASVPFWYQSMWDGMTTESG